MYNTPCNPQKTKTMIEDTVVLGYAFKTNFSIERLQLN